MKKPTKLRYLRKRIIKHTSDAMSNVKEMGSHIGREKKYELVFSMSRKH